MPTRNGGSSANQSLRSELPAGTLNFQKNINYMMERYGLDGETEIKKYVDGVDVSAGGNIARNPSLYAKAITVALENDLKETAKRADILKGEPEVGKAARQVYQNEDTYELAQRLAMKVTMETFKTAGGGQEENSPFAIARQRENGVRVDPMQMKQDITGLFMQYAAAQNVVFRFGYRDAENEENSTKGFVDQTLSRYASEIRAYGQYGKGEFCDIFDKALVAFQEGLGKPIRDSGY